MGTEVGVKTPGYQPGWVRGHFTFLGHQWHRGLSTLLSNLIRLLWQAQESSWELEQCYRKASHALPSFSFLLFLLLVSFPELCFLSHFFLWFFFFYFAKLKDRRRQKTALCFPYQNHMNRLMVKGWAYIWSGPADPRVPLSKVSAGHFHAAEIKGELASFWPWWI